MNFYRLDNKLKKITRIIEKNTKTENNIDRMELLRDLYHINDLIFRLYNIYSSNDTKKNKINKIAHFRSPTGEKILTKKQSKFVFENYGQRITDLHNYIYQLRRNAIKLGKNDMSGGASFSAQNSPSAGNTMGNISKSMNLSINKNN